MIPADPAPHFASGIDLAQTIGSLVSATTSSDVMRVVQANVKRVMSADGIVIIRRDGEYCHYVEEDTETPLWKGRRVPLIECPAARSITNSETLVFPDVANGDDAQLAAYAGTFVKSALIVPVANGENSAAIGIYWANSRQPSTGEIGAAEALGQAVAAALSKSRAYSEISEQLALISFERDEIKHRLKNAYASAIGLAGLALPPEFASPLAGRLSALAAVHDVLDRKMSTDDTVSLGQLLASVLNPYQSSHNRPITLVGPYLDVSAAHATALGLVANELATNAMKHGSLSTSSGKVVAGWALGDGEIHFRWRETEGPLINKAATANQGSRLLRRLVEGHLKGKLEHALTSRGLEFTARLPIAV